MVDELRVPDRTAAAIDAAEQVRKIQNSTVGRTGYSYPVGDSCVMLLAVQMPREWTPEEYFAAIASLKSASPGDSVPEIEMMRIITPAEVPDTDDCTVYVDVHPRFTEKTDPTEPEPVQ